MKLFEYVKYQYDSKQKYWNVTRNVEKEKKANDIGYLYINIMYLIQLLHLSMWV